ncbi:hypothetical protein CEXT_735921 [Caerostris extrusa]|uniref:Uncharacterized protein n=1 Tax=Caerostris extrusa TaxID=172846 RepID=A0AAV4Y387_CAEEX|nr:hypothetical protein CEXT_735921 [Caerostris extrusa]
MLLWRKNLALFLGSTSRNLFPLGIRKHHQQREENFFTFQSSQKSATKIMESEENEEFLSLRTSKREIPDSPLAKRRF